MSRPLAWLAVGLLGGGFAICFWLASLVTSFAQEHHHPPQDAQIHETFYKNWMRPDMPTASCCNMQDCYPAEARFTDGKWFAKRREDGRWLVVPAAKVEQNRSSPDGRNHLCASPYNDVPICFVPGSGT